MIRREPVVISAPLCESSVEQKQSSLTSMKRFHGAFPSNMKHRQGPPSSSVKSVFRSMRIAELLLTEVLEVPPLSLLPDPTVVDP